MTTIMYLMSLAELARSPFSLVDEINQVSSFSLLYPYTCRLTMIIFHPSRGTQTKQGMDAQYERAVHNSLVDVTCQADSGQYFLITPKLLTDLKYHERMKVLCVSNGEWLPDPDDSGSGSGVGSKLNGNMMRMIEGYVNKGRGRAR